MISATFSAMGTTVVIHAPHQRAIRESQAMFERSEERFSRFRPTSELSHINRAGDRGMVVSDDMCRVLMAAGELQNRTGGLVDVGVGTAVRNWGYDATYAQVAGLDEPPRLPSSASWTMEGRVVRLLSGTRLDLGGIAKGWTCDRVVDEGHATVASAGGDVRSTDPTLVVEIIADDDTIAAEVHVGVGALATSSRSKRRWRVGGGEAHHIIDPRTMRPAVTPVLSASVVASTAAEAEAGAKAVLILGADGLKWADEQRWISQAVVQWHDGSVYANTLRNAS